MAAPTLQAQGTIAANTSGNLAITLPTYQTNDIVVITTMGWVPNTATGTATQSLASPWVKYTPDITTITGGLIDAEYAFWWARATSGSSLGTSVTITRPANWGTGNTTSWAGRAYVIRDCKTTGDPFDQLTATAISTAANPAFPAVTVSTDGQIAGNERNVIVFMAKADNTNTPTAATGYTVQTEASTTTGTDAAFQSYTDVTSTSTTAVTPTGGVAPAQGGSVYFAASFASTFTVQRTATGSGTGTQTTTSRKYKTYTRLAYSHSFSDCIDYYQPQWKGVNQGGSGSAVISGAAGTSNEYGQSFTGDGSRIRSIGFWLDRVGTVSGNCYARIWSHTGTFGTTGLPQTLLATSNPVDVTTIPLTGSTAWVYFTFTQPFSTTNGTNYFATFQFTGGSSGNYVSFGYDRSTLASHPGDAAYYGQTGPWALETPTGSDGLFRIIKVTAELKPPVSRTATGSGTGTQTASNVLKRVRTATGSGTGTATNTQNAPSAVLVTFTHVPTQDGSQGNWLNSAGASTPLYTYIDDVYASPDGLFIRGAAGVTDAIVSPYGWATVGFIVSQPIGAIIKLRSARIRARVRATNYVDDTVSLQLAITANSSGSTLVTTTASVTLTNTVYADTGWLTLTPTGSLTTYTGTNVDYIRFAQSISVVNTNDGAYIEVDAVEYEATYSKVYRVTAIGGGQADSISTFRYDYPIGGSAAFGAVVNGYGQTFTPSRSGTLDTVKFQLDGNATPTGSWTARIYSMTGTLTSPTVGSLLATSVSVPVPSSTTLVFRSFAFESNNRIRLNTGTNYVVAVIWSEPVSGSVNHGIGTYGTAGSNPPNTAAAPGVRLSTANSGTTWSSTSSSDLYYQVLSASATITAVYRATGSGTSSQTALRLIKRARTATGSGTGTQTATPRRTRKRTASGSGVGTATVIGARTRARTATGTGSGTQSVVSRRKLLRTVTNAGTGTQTALKLRRAPRSATGSGIGTATAIRKVSFKRTATSLGISTQSGTGARKVPRTATGSGSSTQSAARKLFAKRTVNGSGSATVNIAVRKLFAFRTATGPGLGTHSISSAVFFANAYDSPQIYDFQYRDYNGDTVSVFPRSASGLGSGTSVTLGGLKQSKVAYGSGTGSSTPATFRRNSRRTATGSGTGTAATTFKRARLRTATGTGTGTQTVSNNFKTRYRTASGSGTGTQTTTFRRARLRTATGSGLGTQTVVYRRARRRTAADTGLGTSFISKNFKTKYRTASGSGLGAHFISTVHNNRRNAQGIGGATTGDQAIALHIAPRTATGSGIAIDNPYDSKHTYGEVRLTYDHPSTSVTFVRKLRRAVIALGSGTSTNTQRQAKGFLRTSVSAGTGTAVMYVYFATPIRRNASASGQGTQVDTNVTISTTHGIGASYWGIPALVG